MSWKLIKTIQEATDMRLVLPFGLNLHLGDVISVGRDGSFSLQGSTSSLLGLPPGEDRESEGDIDLYKVYGAQSTCKFRAAGNASTTFPELPSASAGFDIFFGSNDSWVLSIAGRTVHSLINVNQFREPIIDAYIRGVWGPDWAVVTSIYQARKMTLIAANSKNTRVALSISADAVVGGAPVEAQLTANASISATSESLTQAIMNSPTTVGCSGVRVRDSWWKGLSVGDLAETSSQSDITKAPDDAVWENFDTLSRPNAMRID